MTPNKDFLAVVTEMDALKRELEEKRRRLPVVEAAEKEQREARSLVERKVSDLEAAQVGHWCTRRRWSLC